MVEIFTRSEISNYLDKALALAKNGHCKRRNFGAIIVKNGKIVSEGFSKAPDGRIPCTELQEPCVRDKMNITRGTHYEKCRSIHAEQKAVISGNRQDMKGATMFLSGLDYTTKELIDFTTPCIMCKKFIFDAGISQTIVRRPNGQIVLSNVQNEFVKIDDSIEIDLNRPGY